MLPVPVLALLSAPPQPSELAFPPMNYFLLVFIQQYAMESTNLDVFRALGIAVASSVLDTGLVGRGNATISRHRYEVKSTVQTT